MNEWEEITLITESLNGLRAYAEHLAAAGLESNRDKIYEIRNLTECMASFHCVEGHDGDPDARIRERYLEPLDELLAGKSIGKPDFHPTHTEAVIKGLDHYREELEDQCQPVYDSDIRLCTEMAEGMRQKIAREESQAWGQTMQL